MADKNQLLERYKIPQEILNTVKQTFDKTAKKLPSRNAIHKYTTNAFALGDSPDSFMIPFVMRELYLENSFVAYSDEFMTALKNFCHANGISSVAEVLCGTGWLSHWMKKYKIPVKHSVDNKSWPRYEGRQYMRHVKRMDAVKHVKRCRSVELFVMSWPYMDPVAANVWKAMRPGSYLLYIGEDRGGCTADDEFFDLVGEHEVTDDTYETGFLDKMKESFVTFWGIHDEPRLFLKK